MRNKTKQALQSVEHQLGRELDPLERRWFAYGYGLGVQSDTIGLARLDDSWPHDSYSEAATWGVYAGEAERVDGLFDVAFALIDAANRPVPLETELPDFDEQRPIRLQGQNVRPWLIDFATGDDGLGCYGWRTFKDGGRRLRVAEVIDILGHERRDEVVRYSTQALEAIGTLKESTLGADAQVALALLQAAAAELVDELLEANALVPTATPGNLSRPSALAERPTS